MASGSVAEQASAWAPLRERAFALIWCAAVVSNIGTWMHDVAAAWLMTSLAPEPLMVALVQAATSLPIFMFALPAGAMADLIDRRRLLLGLQTCAGCLAAILALIVAAAPSRRRCCSCSRSCSAPWRRSAPRPGRRWCRISFPSPCSPRPWPSTASASTSPRAIGPALGGLVITALGIAWPFVLNAVSFLAVILALWLWRREARPASALPAERFLAAIRAGLRYARSSAAAARHPDPLRRLLPVRQRALGAAASAARGPLAGGPGLYGALLTGVGLGAVTGALLLPSLKQRLGADLMVALGTAALALAMTALALFPAIAVALAACFLAGLAWISVLSSLNVSAQMALPAWVRSRGLAVNLAVFFGSMATGSILWGWLAGRLGLDLTLLDRRPGRPRRDRRHLALEAPRQRHRRPRAFRALAGPGPGRAGRGAAGRCWSPSSTRSIRRTTRPSAPRSRSLAAERRRDGAFFWQVYADAENPRRRVEAFMLESWLDHLRQHERVTEADRRIQEQVNAFHRGPAGPRVTHLIASN